jgi:hypothetical protein
MGTIKRILIAALFLLGYWIVWALLVEQQRVVTHQELDTKHHGADMMTEHWDGTVTAYKWQGGRYHKMWARKARL